MRIPAMSNADSNLMAISIPIDGHFLVGAVEVRLVAADASDAGLQVVRVLLPAALYGLGRPRAVECGAQA
jgi:ribosomal protein S12 methylthiotransferase accessory factor YcaO